MPVEVLTIVSPIVAAIALFISLMSWIDSRRISRLTQHYSIITAADRMIGENKDLLRFHGVDPATIEEEYGVTPEELGYLLLAFDSGSISYKIAHGERERVKPFKEGSYWYEILSNDATQRAFPLLQKLFDSRNPFMAACDETIHVVRTTRTPTAAASHRSD